MCLYRVSCALVRARSNAHGGFLEANAHRRPEAYSSLLEYDVALAAGVFRDACAQPLNRRAHSLLKSAISRTSLYVETRRATASGGTA